MTDGKPTVDKNDNSKHMEDVIEPKFGSVDEKDAATAKDSPKEVEIKAKDATEEENETGEEDTFLASKLKTPYGLLVIDGKPTENKDDNSKHVEDVIGSVVEKDVPTAKDSPKEAKIEAGDEKGGESDSSGVKVEDLKKIFRCWYPSDP